MTDKEKIKGCPFCGHFPVKTKKDGYSVTYYPQVTIRCTNESCHVRPCLSEHNKEGTFDNLIKAWNKRASIPTTKLDARSAANALTYGYSCIVKDTNGISYAFSSKPELYEEDWNFDETRNKYMLPFEIEFESENWKECIVEKENVLTTGLYTTRNGQQAYVYRKSVHDENTWCYVIENGSNHTCNFNGKNNQDQKDLDIIGEWKKV